MVSTKICSTCEHPAIQHNQKGCFAVDMGKSKKRDQACFCKMPRTLIEK